MRTPVSLIISLFILHASFSQDFKEDILRLTVEGGEIEGTLMLPEADTDKVVLFISGSGPTDRDGNSMMGVQTDSFKKSAESLALQGIASFRFDKRMVGKSMLRQVKEEDLVFDDFVQDVVGWVNILRTKFKKVIIAGHSEGALIGLLATLRSDAVALAYIAGAGRPIDELIYEQLHAQFPPLADTAQLVMDKIKMGEFPNQVHPMLIGLFRPSVMPYMQSWLQHDPQELIAQLDKACIIIQGTTDIQTTVQDAELLARAQPKAQLRVIEGMNHVLKDAPIDRAENMATYNDIKLPLNQEFIDTLIRFAKTI